MLLIIKQHFVGCLCRNDFKLGTVNKSDYTVNV